MLKCNVLLCVVINNRNVVINLLVAQGPKARLRRGSIEAAASMQLKRVPNNTEFRKVRFFHFIFFLLFLSYSSQPVMFFLCGASCVCEFAGNN